MLAIPWCTFPILAPESFVYISMKQNLKVCGIDQTMEGGDRVLIEGINYVSHLSIFLQYSLLFVIY